MRRLAILLLAALLVLPAAAQNLTGVWNMTESMDEKQDDMDSSMIMTDDMTLAGDGTCLQMGNASMTLGKDDVDLHFKIEFSVSGTWTREGETLTIRNNPKSAKIEVTENNLPGVLKVLIVNTLKKELKKEFTSKKPDVYAIISLTESELVLLEQDVKNPQPETYKRK